jgi:Fe-S-cluster containining protein
VCGYVFGVQPAAGECRVYAHRPYVCRTQGLPLRVLLEGEGEGEQNESGDESVPKEHRDICPLNADKLDVKALPADQCWTIGTLLRIVDSGPLVLYLCSILRVILIFTHQDLLSGYCQRYKFNTAEN